ncbi:hypothetical protein MKX01_020568 [Papaver californicum]|nr:hypothetical protein MKX01_020568 [Papaver californicum]
MVLKTQKNGEDDKIKIPADFVLDSFLSLVEADIEILNDRHYAPLIKLYQKLSNVKLLKISGSSYWGLSTANILLADLPPFCNLVRLEVSSTLWGSWDPRASFVLSMKKFLWFLQLSPNLESIDFTELDMVKFFLANAGVLQTMTIMISKRLSKDYKKQTQIASELLKFPRYSASCELEFLASE